MPTYGMGDVLVRQHAASCDRYVVIGDGLDEDGYIPAFDLDALEPNGINPQDIDKYENLGPIGALLP